MTSSATPPVAQPTTNTKQNCMVMRTNVAGQWQQTGCSKGSGDSIDFVCEKKPTCTDSSTPVCLIGPC